VARSNERCEKVCGRVQSMLEDEKQDRGTSREVEVE